MSGEANVWQPRTAISGNTLSVPQSFIATAGQTKFTLTLFSYALNTGAISVYKNGLRLIPADWIEIDAETITIITPCTLNDVVLIVGNVGMSATVQTDFTTYTAFATVADMVAGALIAGTGTATSNYAVADNSGGASYVILTPAQFGGTPDGVIDFTVSNSNVARLLLRSDTINASQAGATASAAIGVIDAAITALEAHTGINNIDLEGLTLTTSLTATNVNKNYFNGTLLVAGSEGTIREMTRTPLQDYEIARPRTKSSVLDWTDKKVLWLGTSIPHQGATDNTSYPYYACEGVGATVNNNAWSSSHAHYDVMGNAFALDTVLALSMTEQDRLVGLALYGASSAYDPSFDTISNADTQTCDWRIGTDGFAVAHQDVVFLDHNHNDRNNAEGILTPTALAFNGVTVGATTVLAMSAHTLVAGDSIILRVSGIPKLDYAAASVISVTASTVTLAFVSTGFTGTFVSGTYALVDKNTVFGSMNFLISFIWNKSIVYGDGATVTTKVILSGSPSLYTGGTFNTQIFSVGESLKLLADKWSLAYFDITFEYGITLEDNLNYFGDTIHPNTPLQRQSLANYWVSWMNGGIARKVPESEILPAVSQVYTDNREAMYQEISQGYSTPASLLFAGVQGLAEDWMSGIGTWTPTGDTSTIGAAPWGGGENALLCQALVAGNKKSYVEKGGLTLGTNPRWQLDIELPVVSGLTVFPITTSTILNIASGTLGATNGFQYILQLVPGPTSVSFQFAYWTKPTGTGGEEFFIIPVTGFTFEANTKYHIDLIITQATTALLRGSVLLKINGVVVLHKYEELDNFAMINATRAVVGVVSTTTNDDLDLYVSNFDENAQVLTDYSARYTGTFADNAARTVTVVNGVITTIV